MWTLGERSASQESDMPNPGLLIFIVLAVVLLVQTQRTAAPFKRSLEILSERPWV